MTMTLGIGPKESMTEFSFCFERETKLINRLQLASQKKLEIIQWHIMWAYTLNSNRIGAT